jgi:hypothetical protein
VSAVALDSPEDGPGRVSSYAPAGPELACRGGHPPTGGRLDERARRLSHEELAVAEALVAEGHDVRSLGEPRTGGRGADLTVCGSTLEVKSFLSLEERGGARPSAFSVYNKLVDAAGQSQQAAIYAKGSGLTEQAARRGLARYTSAPGDQPKLDRVRIMGDGFDLSVARRQGRSIAERPERGPELGL